MRNSGYKAGTGGYLAFLLDELVKQLTDQSKLLFVHFLSISFSIISALGLLFCCVSDLKLVGFGGEQKPSDLSVY